MGRRIPNSLTTLAVVAFLLFFFTPDALAATYYIDSVGGSDSNNGTSTTTPWQTVTNINTHTFVAGDTVYFKRGDTFSNAKITLFDDSGSSGNPITFDAYGTGADPILDAGSQNRLFDLRNSASYITIQNLKLQNPSSEGVLIFSGTFTGLNLNHLAITGTTTTGILISSNATSSSSVFDNLTIYGFSTGINGSSSRWPSNTFSNLTITASSTGMTIGTGSLPITNLTITSSTIKGESSNCILLNNVTTATIDSLIASNCGSNGIQFLNVSSGISITNSTFSNNTGRGVRFDSKATNSSIATSTISNNTSDGIILLAGALNTTFSNLTVNSNGLKGINGTMGGSSDSLTISSSIFNGNGTASESTGVSFTGSAGTVTISRTVANNNTTDGFGFSNGVTVNVDMSTSTGNGVDGIGSDGDGFSWHDTSTGTLSNSYAWDNKKSGITNNATSSITVYNSVFGYTTSAGTNAAVTLLDNAALSFYNNTLINPSQAGTAIDMETTGTTTLRNNLIYGFSAGIYKPTIATNVSEDYNIVAHTGTASVSGSGFSLGSHSTTTDPQLVDVSGGNYRLVAASVAINAGTNSLCPVTDKDGITRQGVCDIGAYEYIDITAPVISLSGASTITQTTGQTFTDPGATATDNVDDSVSVTTTGSVNTAVAGTYTLTYSATDAAGNISSVTRTVVIQNGGNGSPLLLGSSGGFSAPSAPLPQIGTTTATTTVGSKSGLTSAQIGAILSLLSSFEVPQSTIQTVSAILSGTGATASSSFTFKNFLTIGSTGTEVLELQKRLAALGYFTVESTGYFGPVTKAAVKAFQGAHGLDQFGYVGPGTRAALNGQ